MPDFDDGGYPEDTEPQDDDLCGDPECSECYPERNQQGTPYTISFDTTNTWTFTTDSATSVPFVDTTEEDVEETEGEEVPENTEENPVRPSLVPEELIGIRGVTMYTPGGNRMRPGSTTVRDGYIVQMAFWDMSPETVRQAFTILKQYCAENEFHLRSLSNEYYSENDVEINIPYYFVLCSVGRDGSIDPNEQFVQQDCSCGRELEYPTVICPDCDQMVYCAICRKFRTDVRWDDNWGSHCDQCGVTCGDCEEIHHTNHARCPSCHPSIRCRACPQMIYTNDEGVIYHEHNGHTFCNRCYTSLCYSCGNVQPDSDNIIVMDDGDHQCVTCVSRNSNEEWDETSELANESLAIPTIPGRETIRLVGVEIEGANGEGMIDHDGGNLLARTLYHEGLSSNDMMGGYHSSRRGQLVHVERDSSVDWEMVIGPLNVAEPTHVDILNRSVKVVRGFINDKTLKLDMRAGLHIHVGADRVPFHNAYNLHKLYMYMEDFLYRFGAAKWPYHRSINRRGRDQAGKSPNTDGKLTFARTFTGQRYYGLSFDNYFARYFDQCECGARTYGLFDECTCDLGKCTFEFRLFNTTANTIKLHAYLAMCQALVAKAIEMDEIKDAKQYPALDFIKSRASDMRSNVLRKMNGEWEKRIVFVNEELPLTPEEKKSIHYCIMNSEMGKTVANADILLEMEDN